MYALCDFWREHKKYAVGKGMEKPLISLTTLTGYKRRVQELLKDRTSKKKLIETER